MYVHLMVSATIWHVFISLVHFSPQARSAGHQHFVLHLGCSFVILVSATGQGQSSCLLGRHLEKMLRVRCCTACI